MVRIERVSEGEGSVGRAHGLTQAALEPHRNGIRRYLVGILRPDEIEDATQTVFQRALENLHRFRGASSPRVWLLGIARNVGLEVARARQREVNRTVRARSPEGSGDISGDVLPAEDPTQEEILGRKEQHALALAALDGMSLDDKLALLVTYVDNLPGPEAAEILGVSFAAFRQRLARARQNLRKRLEERLKDGEPGRAETLGAWEALLRPEPADASETPSRDETIK